MQSQSRKAGLAVIALLAALAIPAAGAAEDAPDYATTTLSGDWGGTRSDLWQSGVAFEAGLKLDSLHNRGGASDGSQTVSHLELKLRADLEKLLGWAGTVAYLNTDTDAGAGINASSCAFDCGRAMNFAFSAMRCAMRERHCSQCATWVWSISRPVAWAWV